MEVVNVTRARRDLYQIVDNLDTSGPMIITPKDSQSVILSKKEWEEIQETIYLLSDPDMMQAVREARETSLDELEVIDWKESTN